MADIQYAPVPKMPVKTNTPPAWLEAVLRFLGRLLRPVGRMLEELGLWLGKGWHAVEVLLLVLAVIGAAWIAWNLLWPLWRDRRPAPEPVAEWAPERAAALALLEDADRLAAEGRFGEAAHLLLQRSVHHIATARPDWLSPSSTAREIGAIDELPWDARQAFGIIAREVERSLFALRGLAAADWQRARAAYADFALVRILA